MPDRARTALHDRRPSRGETLLHAVPAPATRPASDAAPGGHRQNGMGDVVVPVEHGEIVALPRLWDFGLERVDGDAAVLRTDTGLTAIVTFLADTAVVDGVADETTARLDRGIA